MAAFYLDHNVPHRVAALLRAEGHVVTTTRELRRERASDVRQLLVAASRGWILVTHDDDYLRLHRDWADRPSMLRSTEMHGGILIIPAFPIWDADRTAAEIVAFLASPLPLPGNCYQWQRGGWMQC
jgi:hypothetical protein